MEFNMNIEYGIWNIGQESPTGTKTRKGISKTINYPLTTTLPTGLLFPGQKTYKVQVEKNPMKINLEQRKRHKCVANPMHAVPAHIYPYLPLRRALHSLNLGCIPGLSLPLENPALNNLFSHPSLTPLNKIHFPLYRSPPPKILFSERKQRTCLDKVLNDFPFMPRAIPHSRLSSGLPNRYFSWVTGIMFYAVQIKLTSGTS